MNIESKVEDFYNVPNKLRKHKNQIKMNHEFLEAQIKEAKDCIKYYTRKAVVAKAMMHVEGCDIDYERHQIQLYESMVTDNENLLDIFFTARDLSNKAK